MEYMPVLYPGFSWINLKGTGSESHTLERRGGHFFWEQFIAAKKLGIRTGYVAMFDEVDEATAIFKVTNSPPTQAKFKTLEGKPSDWYLRLTQAGSKLLKGKLNSDQFPLD